MKQPSKSEKYREEMKELENEQIYGIVLDYVISRRGRIKADIEYKYKKGKRHDLSQLFSYHINVIEDYLLEQESQKAQEKQGVNPR